MLLKRRTRTQMMQNGCSQCRLKWLHAGTILHILSLARQAILLQLSFSLSISCSCKRTMHLKAVFMSATSYGTYMLPCNCLGYIYSWHTTLSAGLPV